MKRETREGILRTALVTHHAKHDVMLPQVDEFIARVCDAEEAQEQRDAAQQLKDATAAVISLAEKQDDRQLVIRHVEAQVRANEDSSDESLDQVAQAWHDAGEKFKAGDPSALLALTRDCAYITAAIRRLHPEAIGEPLIHGGLTGTAELDRLHPLDARD